MVKVKVSSAVNVSNILKIVAAMLCCWLLYQLYDVYNTLAIEVMSAVSQWWILFLLAHLPVDVLEWAFREGWYLRAIILLGILLFCPIFAWIDKRKLALNFSLHCEQRGVQVHFHFRQATLILLGCAVFLKIVLWVLHAFGDIWWWPGEFALCALWVFVGIMVLGDLFTVKPTSDSAVQA